MTRPFVRAAAVAGVLLGGATAGPSGAQPHAADSIAPRPAATASDATAVPSRLALQAFAASLTETPRYVRELFVYTRFGRPDPVTPPSAVSRSDAFPELTLSGIVYDERTPRLSAALVRIANREPSRRIIRVGDVIDQFTVVRVERKRVLLDMHLLGSTQRVVLEKDPKAPERSSTRQAAGRPSSPPSGAPTQATGGVRTTIRGQQP